MLNLNETILDLKETISVKLYYWRRSQ